MKKIVLLRLCILFNISVSVAAKPKIVLGQIVSEAERRTIIDVHNQFRSKLATGRVAKQPEAKNMKQLRWDEKLAKQAQDIANTLKFEHVNVTDNRWHHVGQNLALLSFTKPKKKADWNFAITNWFNEVKDYKYGDRSSTTTGHYLQIAWAQTTNVGCGYRDFTDFNSKFKYKQLYVCNYGPGGNVLNEKPYLTGKYGCIGLCV